MSRSYAKKGDWNSICEVCGFKFKASRLKLRWDGLRVCSEDWEPRHPMDLYRGPIGTESQVPWTSPEPTDVLIDVSFPGSSSTDLPGSTFDAQVEAAASYHVGWIVTRGLGLSIDRPEYIVTQGLEEA